MNDDIDLATRRGQLLVSLRKQTSCKTRAEFCKKYEIPVPTLKNWEKGVPDEISVKGLKRIVSAFQNEGIICTEEYILNGGLKDENLTNAKIINDFSFDPHIEKLAASLNNLYERLEFAKVIGNTQHPFLNEGDIVVGIKHKPDDIVMAYEKLCIINTINNATFVMIVEKTTLPNIISLATINNDFKSHILLNLAEIIYIAPMLLIKRKAAVN